MRSTSDQHCLPVFIYRQLIDPLIYRASDRTLAGQASDQLLGHALGQLLSNGLEYRQHFVVVLEFK